jgi:hypothetical protein
MQFKAIGCSFIRPTTSAAPHFEQLEVIVDSRRGRYLMRRERGL